MGMLSLLEARVPLGFSWCYSPVAASQKVWREEELVGPKRIGSANVLPQQSRSEQSVWLAVTALAGDETRISRFGRGRMMKEPLALEGVVEFAPPGSAPLGPAGATRGGWEGGPATVEIVAPDRFCAQVFLELMGSLFPVELVGTGASWVIRLQPPHGSAWEGRLLLLVQRWLEACPLPCATIGYGGRSYVFRSALTHSAIGSGFDGPHGLEPAPAAGAAKSRLRSTDRTARASSTRAGFRQRQIALVTRP